MRKAWTFLHIPPACVVVVVLPDWVVSWKFALNKGVTDRSSRLNVTRRCVTAGARWMTVQTERIDSISDKTLLLVVYIMIFCAPIPSSL